MSWLQDGEVPGLLHAVQMSGCYQDCKQFVDMPLVDATQDSLRSAWAAFPRGKGGAAESQLGAQGSSVVTTQHTANSDAQEIRAFVEQHFLPPGQDLDPCAPEDWDASGPAWIQGLQDPPARELASAVHRLWPSLHRKVSASVKTCPERHTLLPLPHPFIIPGERFRECYYWDSYWVVRGLLASGMRATARSSVLNLLHLVNTYGHVPNGARTYYINRSQPPLLSSMVMSVSGLHPVGRGPLHMLAQQQSQQQLDSQVEEVDEELLEAALPCLLAEWVYWNTGAKAVHVTAPAGTGKSEAADGSSSGDASGGHPTTPYLMSRYWADWGEPRPESYREDWALGHSSKASGVTSPRHTLDAQQHAGTTSATGLADSSAAEAGRQQLWRDVSSAAESGWDFSTRWLPPGPSDSSPAADMAASAGPQQASHERAGAESGIAAGRRADLRWLRTTQILPADLNAWLMLLARDIATIAWWLGHSEVAQAAAKSEATRRAALNELAWSPEKGCWHDLLLCGEVAAGTSTSTSTSSRDALLHLIANGQAPAIAMPAGVQQRAASSSSGTALHVQQLVQPLASSWVPLWAGAHEPGSPMAHQAVQGLLRSGLIQPAGVLTSLVDSGEQWDAPNCWPPLLHMMVEGLAGSGGPQGAQAARQLAGGWLGSAREAWLSTGQMHEKLNALRRGAVGAGGEYTPQVGFGWTNGVVLDLLHQGYLPL